jgi:hypothetical protein
MRVLHENKLDWDECENLANSSMRMPSICTTQILEVYKDFDITNLNQVLATTIGRILKYKRNPKEVFILTTQCLRLLQAPQIA